MNLPSLAIEEARAYNRQELADLYDRHNAEIYRYAFRMLGDSGLAEDCVSETYSRFLRAIKDGMSPVQNPRAYLYRVAHNWITDHYRRRHLPEISLDEETKNDIQDDTTTDLSKLHEIEQVRAALMQLPPEQRQVIELRFLEDWSHDEVAVLMGKSIQATRALQHRALTALKRMLGNENELARQQR